MDIEQLKKDCIITRKAFLEVRDKSKTPALSTRPVTYNTLLSWCDKILFVIEEVEERDQTIREKEGIIEFKSGQIEDLRTRVSVLEQKLVEIGKPLP